MNWKRLVFLFLVGLLCNPAQSQQPDPTHNGFVTPIWIRSRESPYSPISVSAQLNILNSAVSGRVHCRSIGMMAVAGKIEGDQVALEFFDDEGTARGVATGTLVHDRFELSALFKDGPTPLLSGHLSLDKARTWRISPLLPANRNLRDQERRIWWRPDFDDSAWTPGMLPDVNSFGAEVGQARLFRTRFLIEDLSGRIGMTFSSDGGIWIYVNGRYFGQWGGDLREGGCVNHPQEGCGEHGRVPVVEIPLEWLVEGENTIAVKVINAACCSSYFNLLLRSSDAAAPRP